MRKTFLVSLILAFAACGASAQKPPPSTYTFMVNDGGTAHSVMEMTEMYGPLMEAMEAALGHKMRFITYKNMAAFVDDTKRHKPEVIFVKTPDLGSRAIRDDGYHVVAKRSDPYIAGVIANVKLAQEIAGGHPSRNARAGAPVVRVGAGAVPSAVSSSGTEKAGLEELLCHDLILPPADTTTAKLTLARLRKLGLPFRIMRGEAGEQSPGCDAIAVRHVAFQEAVLEMMAGHRALTDQGNNFVSDPGDWYPRPAAGAVNPSMLKAWRKDPSRLVLAELPPIPNWAVLVGPSVPEHEREALKKALLHLGDKEARTLEPLTFKHLAPATDEEYLELLAYIGG